MSEDSKYVPSPIVDETYDLMMVTHGRIVAMLEGQGMDPCPAIKIAHDLMNEAFAAWGILVGRDMDDAPNNP